MTQHHIAFWNVENLFGPEDHAPRIPWVADAMRRDLRGWTQALYDTKQDQLAKVITALNGGKGPDILGLCEVEDRFVLDDLVARVDAGTGRRYGVVHADNLRDKRGIDTAFIFDAARYSVDTDLVFSHFVIRRTGTRDILQATFQTPEGRALVCLANHWPARSGGVLESAGFRATAGETLAYWHGRIREEAPDGKRACIVAMGDLNDDPWDGSVCSNANATRERGDVERAQSPKFYNLSWEYLKWASSTRTGTERVLDGTLYYNNDGNIFDQILMSRPLLDGGDAAFKMISGTGGPEPIADMVSHRMGEGAIRFGLPKGNAARNVDATGYSDHFPVSVILEEGQGP
ncbi:endonuclease/exonuclease/phosphatase family protein [Tateyamaria pelophila]|uniref:endonuclease/exonuclease/phosphatase family protein n=1 Tax=Tateyamaria pelophila TaxID=328415 RepID=UPI001CBF3E69|nr:endonuclease/exonuclease/phosphatase family protein [Tateyamaria pelophila]